MEHAPARSRPGPAAAGPPGPCAGLPHTGVDRDVPGAVEDTLREYLTRRLEEADATDGTFGRDIAERVVSFTLRGGKRLRPAFAWWAWRACGGSGHGPRARTALRLAAALELLQTGALVHDDMMDGSSLRRGAPSVHTDFAARHAQAGLRGSAAAYGRAAAVLAGDLALVWADDLVAEAELDHPGPTGPDHAEPHHTGPHHAAPHHTGQDRAGPGHVANDGPGPAGQDEPGPAGPAVLDAATRRAVRAHWRAMRTEMVGGQYLDLHAQAGADESLTTAVRVACLKTALYTVERPLALGAALAGADDRTVRALCSAGRCAGIAFQLRDDLLGVFGDPEQTGKPAGDDLREGKPTYLVAVARARARETGDQDALDTLAAGLGDPGLTPEGLARLRSVLLRTGARDLVEAKIGRLLDHSTRHLAGAVLESAAHRELAAMFARAAGVRTAPPDDRPDPRPGHSAPSRTTRPLPKPVAVVEGGRR
ncbi:polyprenyl synthetase family protein [Streptomyces sp. GC420]|nr:polyprenyl synthetase family protein [Streptomyces sp. GC420]